MNQVFGACSPPKSREKIKMKHLTKKTKTAAALVVVLAVFSGGAQSDQSLSRQQVFNRYALFNQLLIKNGSIQPHWMKDGRRFWFAENTPQGNVIFLVKPRQGKKTPFFDTPRLRRALTSKLGHEPQGPGLPFRRFDIVENETAVQFKVENKEWICRLDTYDISPVTPADKNAQERGRPRLVEKALIYGSEVDIMEASSPDGFRFLGTENFNLYIRSSKSDRKSRLTEDGKADFRWSAKDALWSPDGSKVAVQKVDFQGVNRYPVVQWLREPEEVEWKPYTKTGKPLLRIELYIIDVNSGAQVRIRESGEVDHYYRLLNWTPDGSEIIFTKANRIWNRIDVLAARTASGDCRLILNETAQTFFSGRLDSKRLFLLQDGKRFLWMSERDGWQHIYMYDIQGNLLRQLTQGSFPVLSIVAIDEQGGWVYFTAHGEERLYDTHLYRINLEGQSLIRLTEGEGNHAIQFGPSLEFFLDTHSTVSKPPVTELRKADGTLIQTIVKADIGPLLKLGWTPPEEFIVKAADSTTPLYGVLFKPHDFDPSKTYPVVDFIYGGPIITHVPRTFTSSALPQALAQNGIIVFVVDNRGTPERGKAFHDVAFQNFGQFEVSDHVAALRQLAAARSYMDLGRVGIYGGSWGGYMTIRALLTAPEVFHVGVSIFPVADIDDHIPAIERYMGLPRDNKEGYRRASNIPLAEKLKGSLLIIAGTSDLNAPLTSVFKMSKAFIEANRPFQMVVMPGQGHKMQMSFSFQKDGSIALRGNAGFIYESIRRYFIEHLNPEELKPKELK
jgi:dipeptidyl-peptidase-4